VSALMSQWLWLCGQGSWPGIPRLAHGA